MTVNKSSKTITFVTTDLGNKLMIAKDLRKPQYTLYLNGKDTGYKFSTWKSAVQFCVDEY